MHATITNNIKGSVDLASGVITIDDFETSSSDIDVDGRSLVERHYRQVLDTKETIVREALIKLGWTPPPGLLHSKREGGA